MTNSLPEIFLVGLISFGVGFIVGQLVEFRRVGKKVTPHVKWEHNGRWLKVVMIILFLMSTGFLVNFTYHQRECNRDVVNTIKIRSDASQAISDLNDDRTKAISQLVQTIIDAGDTPQDARRTTVRIALGEYQDTLRRLETDRARQSQVRSDNQYPRC